MDRRQFSKNTFTTVKMTTGLRPVSEKNISIVYLNQSAHPRGIVAVIKSNSHTRVRDEASSSCNSRPYKTSAVEEFLERSLERKPRQGRPRATTAREDRHLSIIVRHNLGATASQLSRYFYADTGTRVSKVTVSKRLYERGLFARRPSVCVPLMSMNRRFLLAWCRQHRDWSMDQWVTVLFTDESRFSLNTDSRRTFIYREPGTRYVPFNVHEIVNYGGGGLMV
ncbi:HTH_Tnp_Tc3_2 domain-containing protein [Trichonephila clavipes]|nr:HTH_Tnp_Tc3_2 domain-containing protein [Trichonephila clavipes]